MSENYNDEYNEAYDEDESSNRKAAKVLLAIVGVILIIFGAAYTGYYMYSQYSARQDENRYTEVQSVTEEPSTKGKKVKNPVDFKNLQKQNDEIYAWLKVPGTKVDYPVVQSASSDEFYLKHSALTRKWTASGAVYTQMVNAKTFEDRVTVIYGHNGYSDTMFTTLHYFEDKEFFNSHDVFYIYMPKAKLTYRIISAFKFDDRHIMNTYEFQDNAVYKDFLAMIQDPKSTVKNTRKILDKPLALDDNIVVLSTCVKNQKSNRYLVCGVLINNEKTD